MATRRTDALVGITALGPSSTTDRISIGIGVGASELCVLRVAVADVDVTRIGIWINTNCSDKWIFICDHCMEGDSHACEEAGGPGVLLHSARFGLSGVRNQGR